MVYHIDMAGKKKFTLLLASLLLISVILNFLLLYSQREENRVRRVVDGDSFDLAGGRRIRLLGLDAPEKNRCYFTEARERLKDLILGKIVTLKDTVTDNYGRTLANVYIKNTFVNQVLLEEGLTRFTYATSPYYEDLKANNLLAKKLKRGIYSPLCRTTSDNLDCLIKGNNNHSEKIYFLPTCRNYGQVIVDESFGDLWLCSEEEAIQGGFRRAAGC